MEAIRSDFVTNASHELKTPAATIKSIAETIRAASQDDLSVIPRFSAQLEEQADRLAQIVSDLLDLSRLETGTADLGGVDLEGLVKSAVQQLRQYAVEGELNVEVRTEPSPVRGSANDLSLMIDNLIQNAIRYTPKGGQIGVHLHKAGSEVILEVSDNGIGIPRRDHERIFERFYRVDPGRSRGTGGTGLGLSIVKHVCENHGGSVRVASELGLGTTFTVALPAEG
jgi:signal transduction histidine kinase